MLRSERNLKRPEKHMPPGLRRKLPSIIFFLLYVCERVERSNIRELRILQQHIHVICTAAAVMELYASTGNVTTYGMSCVQYQQQNWPTCTGLNAVVALQAMAQQSEGTRAKPTRQHTPTLLAVRCAWQWQTQPNLDAEAPKGGRRSMARMHNLRGV